MAKWFRSEPMEYISLIMNEDAAHDCLGDLGKLGVIQFTDVRSICTLVLCCCVVFCSVLQIMCIIYFVEIKCHFLFLRCISHCLLCYDITMFSPFFCTVKPRFDSFPTSICLICQALRRIGAQASLFFNRNWQVQHRMRIGRNC